jgi:hypothetical protein
VIAKGRDATFAAVADETGLYSADLARFGSQNSSSRPPGLPSLPCFPYGA